MQGIPKKLISLHLPSVWAGCNRKCRDTPKDKQNQFMKVSKEVLIQSDIWHKWILSSFHYPAFGTSPTIRNKLFLIITDIQPYHNWGMIHCMSSTFTFWMRRLSTFFCHNPVVYTLFKIFKAIGRCIVVRFPTKTYFQWHFLKNDNKEIGQILL